MRRLLLGCVLVAATASGQITNIRRFLDQCPQNDPAFTRISADFQIRRNGLVVNVPPCTEPVSAMATSAYTDELIVLQALRVIYYMDRGQYGHLPWTNGTLYDWMTTRIGGIDIVQGGSFCCEVFGYTPPPPPPPTFPPTPPPLPPPVPVRAVFIAIGAQDDFNREFDKMWRGIAGDIDLYAHETRHTSDFPHSSCCGIPGGCDNTFDIKQLSPYGVQWWLNKLWLDGTINVGMQCLPPIELHASIAWFRDAVGGSGFAARFCDVKPAVIDPPALPGGRCIDGQRLRAVAHR